MNSTRGLRLEQESDNDLGVAINLGNLGYAYEYLGKLDLAIDYYERSLAVNQRLVQFHRHVHLLHLPGHGLPEKKNYPLAMDTCKKRWK